MSTVGPLQWGATFAAVQAEGAALASDWFAWERDGEAPPSFDGNGFAVDFADDLRLLRQFGAGAVRLTVDWARIEPGEGHVDGAVLDRYREVLGAARAEGLDTIVALVDGPLPGWFSIDERGWRDRRARTYFWPRHVERVGDHLGDLVSGWVPIVRPVGFARGAFITATAPPGTRSVQRFVETVQGCFLASLEAWRVLRGAAPVALGVEGAPVRSGEEGGERPAKLYDTLQWAWTAALRDGAALPRLPPVRLDGARGAFDAIALTFDGGYAVGADGRVARYRREDELLATLHRVAEHRGERPVGGGPHPPRRATPRPTPRRRRWRTTTWRPPATTGSTCDAGCGTGHRRLRAALRVRRHPGPVRPQPLGQTGRRVPPRSLVVGRGGTGRRRAGGG
ncbi:MAG: family 1 glycosylhydrolase [Acidimicrobiales bacterium]